MVFAVPSFSRVKRSWGSEHQCCSLLCPAERVQVAKSLLITSCLLDTVKAAIGPDSCSCFMVTDMLAQLPVAMNLLWGKAHRKSISQGFPHVTSCKQDLGTWLPVGLTQSYSFSFPTPAGGGWIKDSLKNQKENTFFCHLLPLLSLTAQCKPDIILAPHFSVFKNLVCPQLLSYNLGPRT
jgi:hypothetical protein